MKRTLARLGAALLATGLVAMAAPAVAHVTVSSPDAASGGFGKVVFRVPTESETASTDKITITLPADQPLAFVSAQPKPGWTVKVTEKTLPKPVTSGDTTLTKAVRTVTWTADGPGIAPGQFDEFAISGGPLPDADSMMFTAQQHYDDGTVVAWDEKPAADGEEPEHPAPTLELAAETKTDSESGSGTTDDDADDDSDVLPVSLSVVAVVLAAGALVVSLRQNRRRA